MLVPKQGSGIFDFDDGLSDTSAVSETSARKGSLSGRAAYFSGGDPWKIKASEAQRILYQRWLDCSILSAVNLPEWSSVMESPTLGMLSRLETVLVEAKKKKQVASGGFS